MKKLLLILLCLPIIGFGQTALDILEDGYNFNSLVKSSYEDDLIILEGNDINEIEKTIKKWKYSSKESAIRVVKHSLLECRKYTNGYKPMYLLNESPVGIKKNYFELYWRTAIESFPFVDNFNFREKYGYSYRNELDDIYAALKHMISIHEQVREGRINHSWIKGKGPNQYTFEDFAPYSTFKRNSLENLIEGFAKYTPFFLFILIIWFLYRTDSQNKNFINKYLYFGFIKDENHQKRLRKFLITIFILPQILILLQIIDNSDLLYVSIFENLSLSFLPNEKMNRIYLDFIESPIRVEWHKVIFANICVFLSSYILTCMINFRNLKSN